jgi:hypothetical protein
VFAVLFDPPTEDTGELFIRGPSSKLLRHGVLTGFRPLAKGRHILLLSEEGC